MGLLDSFALLGLLVVGLPVAVGVGWLLEKVFRAPWLRPIPFVLLLVAVIGGVPLALQVAGVRTEARVVARTERVVVNARDGRWWSAPRLQVRYAPTDPRRADPSSLTPARDSVTTNVRIGAVAYDHTPVGAIVPVTYVGFRPSVAKLTDRTLGDLGREAWAVGGVPTEVTTIAAVLLAVVAWSWSPRAAALRVVRRGAVTVCTTVAMLAGARRMLTSPARGPDDPVPAAGVAHVAAISTLVNCEFCTSGERLEQPFEVVTLDFTPPGARFPVATADAIDTGSVRGLAEGGVVRMHYAPDRPRAVRIDGATRTFEVRNGRDTILLYAAFWAIVGAAYLVGARLRRRTA